jgi:hypothetical protein
VIDLADVAFYHLPRNHVFGHSAKQGHFDQFERGWNAFIVEEAGSIYQH